MSIISDEFAAEIVGKMRAGLAQRDETVTIVPSDPEALLLIWLYDQIESLKKGTAFLGVGGGIPQVKKVDG